MRLHFQMKQKSVMFLKTKENCFKKFSDLKVILNKKKKKNLQVMYVRDVRVSRIQD